MTVYFIRRLIDSAIKIGFTDRDPLQRMREIQNAAGLELEFLVAVEGDRDREQTLHQDYVEFRLYGEWFAPSEQLESLVQALQWRESPEGQAHIQRESLSLWMVDALCSHVEVPGHPDPFAEDTRTPRQIQALRLIEEIADRAIAAVEDLGRHV